MKKIIYELLPTFIKNKVKKYYTLRKNILSQKLADKNSLKKLKYSCHIKCNFKDLISKGVLFPHPVGIVISSLAKIGRGCVIYQNVTIGAKHRGLGDLKPSEYAPDIGENVIIYSGAVIIGGIKVGDNSIIGANAVVSKDVPENSVVYGFNKIKNSRR